MTHKNPPRKKVELSKGEILSCRNCLQYDITEDLCELHGLRNLTNNHICKDHSVVEEEEEDF